MPPIEADRWPGRHLVVPVLAILAVAIVGARSATPAGDPAGPAPETTDYPPVRQAMPDFASISDSQKRKSAFFHYLLPVVERVNGHIRQRRHRLMQIARRFRNTGSLSSKDRKWLDNMADYYQVDADDTANRIAALKPRIDVWPPSLALAQAAIESAWGTSRFARKGKNLFGEWCFQAGCGIVPAQRPSNREYEVKSFPSVQASIRSYMHNLNTHAAYSDMRRMRQQERRAGRELDAARLAKALDRYSERGETYVEDVRTIIRANDLPSLVDNG